MPAPTRYRSGYTGQEIDQLLSTISSKIDESYIVNDFSGGTDKIASAELAKILNDAIIEIKDPNYFKDLLESVPNNNLFTDSLKTKLEGLNEQFKGVYTNAAARDAAILTANLHGGELTFLLDDGSDYHLQSWDYWDNTASTWRKAKQYKLGDLDSVVFASVGSGVFTSFDKTLYNSCEVLLTAKAGNQMHVTKVLITTNGTDVWMTEYGYVGNASLMDVTADMVGNSVRLICTTTSVNVTVKGKKIVEH